MPAIAPRPITYSNRLNTTVYALMIVAAAGFAAVENSFAAVLIVGTSAVCGWLLVDSRKALLPHGVPKLILNALVLLAACFLWYEIQNNLREGDQSVIISLSHFVVALMACKCLEPKRPRDLPYSVALGMLLVVSATIFSATSLFMMADLLVFLAMLAYVGALANVEHAVRNMTQPGAVVLPENSALLRRDLRRVAKWGFVAMLPCAVIFFCFTPRHSSASLLPVFNTGAYETGFSDNVQLHDFGTISQSDTVVMNVRITRRGENIGTDYSDLYFRGLVDDEYSGYSRRWGQSNQHRSWNGNGEEPLRMDQEELGTLWRQSITLPNEDDIKQEYTLFVQHYHVLFSLATPIAWEKLPAIHFTPAFEELHSIGSVPVRYTLYSRPSFDPPEAKGSPITEPGLLRDGIANTTDPRYQKVVVAEPIRTLARSIAKDLLPADNVPPDTSNILLIVKRFETYLKSNYRYSLTFQQVDPKLDPTTDFLLNRKLTGGHCEFFASAQCMLCRAVGINARMVNGYHGGEFNAISGQFIVRERDAHSWTEVYIPKDNSHPDASSGWIISDPTPSANNLDGQPAIVSQLARSVLDFVQSEWLATVATFDNESRAMLLGWLKTRYDSLGETIDDWTLPFRLNIIHDNAAARAVLPLLASSSALMLISVWTWWRWKSSRRWVHGNGTPGAPKRAVKLTGEMAFLEDLLRQLDHMGKARRADQTPLEFTEQFKVQLGSAIADARELIQIAYSVRFGAIAFDGPLKSRIAASLRRIRAELRRAKKQHSPITA